MRLFIRVGTSKKGSKYRALCMERDGMKRTLTFELEAVLLASGLTFAELMQLAEGEYNL